MHIIIIVDYECRYAITQKDVTTKVSTQAEREVCIMLLPYINFMHINGNFLNSLILIIIQIQLESFIQIRKY